MKKTIILMIIVMLPMFPLLYASDSTSPIISFTDHYELDTEYFFVYGTIYITGAGFQSNSNYSITLVKDISLTNEMTIPEPVPDTITMITTNSEGAITITKVWNQWNTTVNTYLSVGEYTIIIDVDGDGVYNEDIDEYDDMIIRYAGVQTSRETTIPTFHTPELPGGTLAAMIAIIIAMLVYSKPKNHIIFK